MKNTINRRAFLKITAALSILVIIGARKAKKKVRIVSTGEVTSFGGGYMLTGPWRFEWWSGIGPTGIASCYIGKGGLIHMADGGPLPVGDEQFTESELRAAMVRS